MLITINNGDLLSPYRSLFGIRSSDIKDSEFRACAEIVFCLVCGCALASESAGQREDDFICRRALRHLDTTPSSITAQTCSSLQGRLACRVPRSPLTRDKKRKKKKKKTERPLFLDNSAGVERFGDFPSRSVQLAISTFRMCHFALVINRQISSESKDQPPCEASQSRGR